ncbi:MAG: hypothetical protein WBE95_16760 [Trebonia sp.]|uniref:hypothetical protein n=1 Tax=Trebonia sp. TaxID=2767075 RepID=UPI003C74D445
MTGAWRLLELLDEFDELAPLDEFELEPELADPVPVLAPLDEFEPEPELADPVPVLAPGLEVEVEPLECVDALLVEPGSTAATAPAASRLATPTVAVVVFSLRRPRSRSATARETCRAAPWPRGAPLRSSQLSIIAVWHP